MITIFENFSRMVLSSAISATQTQWDFLSVLANAIQRYGAPEALVTDGGGQFYSTVAVQLYDMLGIRKERIDPGQPWENYAETLFSIQRRLGDHAFSNARTWPEIHQAHQTWWQNYNVEHHYAHRERKVRRHSPEAVLRGMLGRTIPRSGAVAGFVRDSVHPKDAINLGTSSSSTGTSLERMGYPPEKKSRCGCMRIRVIRRVPGDHAVPVLNPLGRGAATDHRGQKRASHRDPFAQPTAGSLALI